jgi:hypothetical protein
MQKLSKALVLLCLGAITLQWGWGCNLLPPELEAAIIRQTDFWWERKQGEVEDWFNIGTDGQIVTDPLFDLFMDATANWVDERVPDAVSFAR